MNTDLATYIATATPAQIEELEALAAALRGPRFDVGLVRGLPFGRCTHGSNIVADVARDAAGLWSVTVFGTDYDEIIGAEDAEIIETADGWEIDPGTGDVSWDADTLTEALDGLAEYREEAGATVALDAEWVFGLIAFTVAIAETEGIL